jgi:uncharacterized membrane protein YphA (DoxX/SURF4 family)
MNASQYSGTVIVPTLSRIVLCAAFFTAGWAKVFTDATYTPAEVTTLDKLGVVVRQSVALRDVNPGIIAASMPIELMTQDEPGEPAAAQDTPTVGPESPPADDNAGTAEADEDETGAPSTTPATTTGGAEALALYKVAITLDNAGWQYAWWLAWGSALVELVGGALLFIGLFSRLWGLGLAVTMALAFHIMSMDAFLDAPFAIAQKHENAAMFNQVYAQLALFVLAFGIFITGPGPLSLDRAIFRRTAPDDIEIDMHEPA